MPKPKNKSRKPPVDVDDEPQAPVLDMPTHADSQSDEFDEVAPRRLPGQRGPDKGPRKKKGEPVAEVNTQPQRNPGVAALARDFGLSNGEIEAATDVELSAYVRGCQRALMAENDTLRRQPPPQQQQRREVEEEDPVDWGTRADGTPMTREDWGGAASAHERQHRRLVEERTERKKLEQRYANIEQRVIEQERRTSASDIDALFASMPAKFKHLVGSGPMAALSEADPVQSVQREFRSDVVRAAGDRNDPRFSVKLAAAVARLAKYGQPVADNFDEESDDYDTIPQNRIAAHMNGRPTQEDFINGHAARPTSGKPRPMPKGKERAMRNVADLLAKKNATDEDFASMGEDATAARHEANLPD